MAKIQDRGIILHIQLQRFKPSIWRKFIVPSNMDFEQLHATIQCVMGWDGFHLYQFYQDRRSDEYIGRNTGMIEASREKIKNYLSEKGDWMYYEYDFGDSWEHLIKVKDLKKDEKYRDGNYPRCLEGEMACPLEDSGGVYGYAELLRTLADPQHPEHEEMKEWAGGELDPNDFDLEAINKRLTKRFKLK